ncbi:zinc-dependent peptidase [Desulfurivibrio dismutans]|uniref:M90 family metallopeptidase n=1 Tax=Desulfurivibrio dismutans TaxID=1398908 RepID=UPI0023DAC370|nr:M90 family metallopeptidase [Desulfurivibrio alkaliphilus]MDF1614442.1 zinc-dependent peptidase [Desulfurivibrio alkaliphilus]
MGLWRWWKKWRRARLLRRHVLPDEVWAAALRHPPELFAGLAAEEFTRLRQWVTLFLVEKQFYGARGWQLTPAMEAAIAAQACMPILNLDLDCYAGWRSIVVYEDTFVAPREETDEDGIVHSGSEILAGEAWAAGPVVLSWADCAPGSYPHGPASNVVIHEFAHKLDMLNGAANGLPPLPRGMSRAAWAAALGGGYEQLRAALGHGVEPLLDEYAAEDPAEFFAVVSEYFFMAPLHLQHHLPAVYDQLALYYHQDPAARRQKI